MNQSKHILVVDDEIDLREILQFNLENAGYIVETAASAEEALNIIAPQHDLILLDVMMGGMSGYKMAEHLRKVKNDKTPIIFLTAKDAENDILTGFSVGADDYISKPFSVQEVLARVGALLRRAEITKEKANALPEETIQLDTLRKVALVNGQEIRLSPKELGILQLLKQNQGRVFSREEILNEVWKGESCVGGRTVDVHIAHLRRKLGEEGAHINNRQGYGYCFE
jgi:DNA-binding response OmpR family regulator